MKMNPIAMAVTTALILTASGSHASGSLIASYGFNNTLNSSVAGGPTLGAVDSTSTGGFITDLVHGVSQTVYHVGGANLPATDQGGLTFNSAGVIDPTHGYSLELSFEFLEHDNAWRRIVDTLDRTSDAGFYADIGNNLNVYPGAGSTAVFVSGVYRNVVLTVAPTGINNIHAYIDGGSTLATTGNALDLGQTGVISLFLDNTAGGGQGDWSSVNIAKANFFDGVLSEQQVADFEGNASGGVPEPATWSMMLVGFGGLGTMLRCRRTQQAVAQPGKLAC